MLSPWKKVLGGVAMACAVSMALPGQQAPQGAPASSPAPSGVFHGKRADLGDQTFKFGALAVEIVMIDDKFVLTLENTSTRFSKFDPWDLVVVNDGGRQARLSNDGPFPIAPGASAGRVYQAIPESLGYASRENLIFPIKIFLGEKLIAEVTH